MANIIVIVIVGILLSASISYIVKEKKKGNACIGCSCSSTCGKCGKCNSSN